MLVWLIWSLRDSLNVTTVAMQNLYRITKTYVLLFVQYKIRGRRQKMTFRANMFGPRTPSPARLRLEF